MKDVIQSLWILETKTYVQCQFHCVWHCTSTTKNRKIISRSSIQDHSTAIPCWCWRPSNKVMKTTLLSLSPPHNGEHNTPEPHDLTQCNQLKYLSTNYLIAPAFPQFLHQMVTSLHWNKPQNKYLDQWVRSDLRDMN